MENYVRFKLFGGCQILKSGILPHKFACQPKRPLTSVDLNREAFKKLNQKRLVQEILHEDKTKNQLSLIKENTCPSTIQEETSGDRSKNFSTEHTGSGIIESAEEISLHVSNENRPREFGEGSETMDRINAFEEMVSRGIQVRPQNLIHMRSKGVMCRPCPTLVHHIACNTENPTFANASCSPKPTSSSSARSETCVSSSSSSNNYTNKSATSSGSYIPSTTSSTSSSNNDENEDMKLLARKITKFHISKSPKEYIGIMPECYWLVHLLKERCNLSEENIMLTLMKIKLNDTHSRLGDQFGLSTPQVSRIFNKCVPIMAHLLKKLIYQPSKYQVKKNLPIPFRAHYSNVYAIIDAFEIQIQKPSNPVHQALTWSEYKKCNTLKYLVACTPDGFIVYISKGYGGRVSDTTLFEECGIMDKLPVKISLMADRGFKHVDNILHGQKSELIRPPSVSQSEKPTKQEVLETKRIASLRIHVERVIRRAREYAMLEPHSCLDSAYFPLIDDVMCISCALINLQSPIIKT